MRVRDTIICFVCVIAAGLFLFAASQRLEPIQRARVRMNLVSNEPLENAPPSLAFATVAMGAFRGLVVDILWMRADKLKEEGQFFDAKQLADWITVLQPRFASVWDFQAWNMAYNISVAIPASQWQERWRWVRNGYELLRDKGIEKNPRSIMLYRSLAWIFQHKIGEISDDCHRHYKRELALSMRQLLGFPETNAYFDSLASSPERLDEILSDPQVSEFVKMLKDADKTFESQTQLVNNYLALRQTPSRFSQEAFRVIDMHRDSPGLQKFDTFTKAYQLRSVWKFDINFMRKLNEKYGPSGITDPNQRMPLNWEHPGTHAIYWAELGLERAGKKGEYSIDEKNTERIVFHSLQQLYRSGRLIIYPIPGQVSSVFLEPDLGMFDSCDRFWIKTIEKYETLEKGNPKAVRGGHKNFLINAVALSYQAGHVKQAGRIYNELRSRYPLEEFNVPLVTFVRDRVKEELKSVSINDAIEQILMTLREGYFQYAVGEDDFAWARENWARDVYTIYQKEMGADEPGRMGLPDFEMLKYLAFLGFMNDKFYPEYLQSALLGRIKIEKPDVFEKLIKQEGVFMERLKQQQEQQGSQ